jgi:cytosine/adenosine deaminase-related metal-dependent hydrolase
MRKISAHLILDGKGKCYSKGVLTLDDNGTILNIEETHGNLGESAEVAFYSGMIVPGFVNAHCHLELSHLHHAFPSGDGLIPFLKRVVETRAADLKLVQKAAETADLLMYKNGIVAVGDISNGPATFGIKKGSRIDYLTFVEALGFSPERAAKAFEWSKNCVLKAKELGLKSSLVPHAPYSVSMPLFEAIAQEAIASGMPLTIHSQETVEEDELFQIGEGEFQRHLHDNLGIDTSFFHPTGKKALQSTLGHFPVQNNLLLVHNLFIQQSDINFIKGVRNLSNTWFVLCPGSNIYLQNRLPDFNLFRSNQLQICLGTDSLASNAQLSILEEMKVIQLAESSIPLAELVGWSSFHGANALGISDWAGSIEVGKRPGINLLTGLDLIEQKLLPATKVKKIG